MRAPGLAVALLLLVPAAVRAQDEPTFQFGGGLALASGAVADTHGTGYGLMGSMAFPMGPSLSLRGSLSFARLSRRDDAVFTRLDIDGRLFELSGGYLEAGHQHLLSAFGEARLDLRKGAGVAPYLFAGAGLTRSVLGELGVWEFGIRTEYPSTAETGLGVDAGAGVEVGLGRIAALFAEAAWVRALGGEGTAHLPVRLGLSISPAGR